MVDVDRPDRKARRVSGKSDPVDAYATATAVLSGRAHGQPKTRDGIVEAIRSQRVVRRSAIKSRTQTINQIRTLIASAPAEVREYLRGLPTHQLVAQLARSRPSTALANPTCAVRTALRRLARRYQHLTQEIAEADGELDHPVAQAAPRLVDLIGVGTETAAQLLITAGDNPGRLKSEASFAHLCGAAPISASSGRTDRHRLNRGGDRQADGRTRQSRPEYQSRPTMQPSYAGMYGSWRKPRRTTVINSCGALNARSAVARRSTDRMLSTGSRFSASGGSW
ncbi:transposase [Streptomyces sp. NPDC059466]|uniref:transposase n=1 Tax=unclassified Streptomyces TaxID=2593676 RepID=UPI0036C04CBC